MEDKITDKAEPEKDDNCGNSAASCYAVLCCGCTRKYKSCPVIGTIAEYANECIHRSAQ